MYKTHLPKLKFDKTILDEVPYGIVISDPETRVLYANRAAEDVLGYSTRELSRIPLYHRVHPADQPQVRSYAKALKMKGEMVTKRRFKSGDGNYITIERNTRLLEDGAQLSVCRDVSAEEDLFRRYDLSLALAGHELRNPLASMRVQAELLASILANSPASAEALPLIEGIEREIKRQARLIEDLLNASRVRQDKLSVRMEQFDAHQLLSEAVAHVRASTQRNVILQAAPSRGERLYGDKDLLYQVLLNLLMNAAKFSEAPAPIEVGLVRRRSAWHISVRDYGKGIPKEDQANIFNAFFQSDGNYASGLGLGLFLAREIAKRHRGDLKVESRLGEGSTFTIVLPLA